jgi:hypothetical protein
MQVTYASGSNVIALEPRRMEQVYPAVNEVEAYWTALEAEGSVPRRAEVDPRGIQGALPQAFILERLAPTVARFRLAGMHLNDLMGMEIRGMPMTAMFLPDSRAAAGAALDRAFSTPAKVTLILTGDQGVGRGPLAARMILLPLLDEAGRVTRLLGALQAKGVIGRPPRRFAILESRYSDLTGDFGARTAPPAPSGLAEPPQSVYHQAVPKRPALRLIRDEN